MKVSTENDNNFGYEKITIVVDNIPLNRPWIIKSSSLLIFYLCSSPYIMKQEQKQNQKIFMHLIFKHGYMYMTCKLQFIFI